jgi:hypothetical protein
MTGWRNVVTDVRRVEPSLSVTVASGETLSASEEGKCRLRENLVLPDVLVVEGLEESLISTHSLMKEGYTVTLSSDSAKIQKGEQVNSFKKTLTPSVNCEHGIIGKEARQAHSSVSKRVAERVGDIVSADLMIISNQNVDNAENVALVVVDHWSDYHRAIPKIGKNPIRNARLPCTETMKPRFQQLKIRLITRKPIM